MNKVNLVIPASQKDYNKLPFVVESVRRFVDDVEDIHIITPTETNYSTDNVYFHRDSDVLPYDRTKIKYRPNWVFQQLLKVFQNVTKNDWFLVMDADIFVNKKLPLWEDNKPILYLGRNQYHAPYFEFNKQVMGIYKPYAHSFISEFTLYNKKFVRDMLSYMNLSLDELWEKMTKIVEYKCCIGDAELYGSYIVTEKPNAYKIKHLKTHLGGRYNSYVWNDEEIKKAINDVRTHCKDVDIMSLHSWEGKIE